MRVAVQAALIIAFGVATIGGYEAWRQHMAPDNQLTRACQTVVTSQLVSPSSVKYLQSIVGHGETSVRALSDLQKAEVAVKERGANDPEVRRLLDSVEATKADGKGEIVVIFDSMNRMGAILRGDAVCTYSTNAKDVQSEVASIALDRIE